MAEERVILPKLAWRESPNQSARNSVAYSNPHGAPFLLVAHRPVGSYHGSVDWLCNARSQASCHVLTEGSGTGLDVATQLVRWERKAWTEMSFNSISYGVEVDDDAWLSPQDHSAWLSAARIFAFLSYKTGIPLTWTRDPLNVPGIVRHYDLGAAGGGHTDPTTDTSLWRAFVKECNHQYARGHFRKSWGQGTFKRIR